MMALSSCSDRQSRQGFAAINSPGTDDPLTTPPPVLLPVSEQTASVLVSIVTAPFLASNRPETVAPVVAVIQVSANTVPNRFEVVPSVAELPICQKTLHA